MPENENVPNAAENQGESTPTTGEATTEPTPSPVVEPAPAPEFRYAPGSGVPQWLEGKTAAEAAEIANNLYTATLSQTPVQPAPQQLGSTGYPAPAPQQQPVQYQQPPVSNQPLMPTQDDFLTAPEAATQQTFTNMYDSQVAPAMQGMARQMADMAKAQAQARHSDAFGKWGPEIVAMMGQLSADQTTPQNLDMIVSVVKGNHAGEIEQAAIDARIQQMMDSNTLRPAAATGEVSASGNAGNALDLSNEAFTHKLKIGDHDLSFQEVCSKYNINTSTIDEFLDTAYPGVPLAEARKTYTKLLTSGEAFTEGTV